jgi:hypothetical protein
MERVASVLTWPPGLHAPERAASSSRSFASCCRRLSAFTVSGSCRYSAHTAHMQQRAYLQQISAAARILNCHMHARHEHASNNGVYSCSVAGYCTAAVRAIAPVVSMCLLHRLATPHSYSHQSVLTWEAVECCHRSLVRVCRRPESCSSCCWACYCCICAIAAGAGLVCVIAAQHICKLATCALGPAAKVACDCAGASLFGRVDWPEGCDWVCSRGLAGGLVNGVSSAAHTCRYCWPM